MGSPLERAETIARMWMLEDLADEAESQAEAEADDD